MPRSILEAMALGMPIISTSVGSIAGVIRSGENGLLINDLSLELLDMIKQLKLDSDLRERIGNDAYSDAFKLYEWNSVFNLYRQQIVTMSYN